MTLSRRTETLRDGVWEEEEPLELRQLTIGQARRDALVALALDRVISAAAESPYPATVAVDEHATVDELRIWADRVFTAAVHEKRPPLRLAGALYVLIGVIGADTAALLVGVPHAVRGAVMRAVRDEVVRRAMASDAPGGGKGVAHGR